MYLLVDKVRSNLPLDSCEAKCSSVKMSTIKCLSVFLLASLFYNVANAKPNSVPDSSKFTVTFKYNDKVSWCLGGIIGENSVITSGDCFAHRNGPFVNYTSLKAVIGSHELDVRTIVLFDFPKSEKNVDRAYHDFAVVKLKQKFNLAQNDLIALRLPDNNNNIGEDTVVFAHNEDSNKAEQMKITNKSNCPNDAELTFFDISQLCVELLNDEESCYHQAGAPLVDQGNKLIGIYLECYDEAPYEIFAKVSYFSKLIKTALDSDFQKDGKFDSFIVKNYS